MSFIAGAAATNVDLLYQNMPKIPGVGEEVYTDRFSLQLGGGLPATLINRSSATIFFPHLRGRNISKIM